MFNKKCDLRGQMYCRDIRRKGIHYYFNRVNQFGHANIFQFSSIG